MNSGSNLSPKDLRLVSLDHKSEERKEKVLDDLIVDLREQLKNYKFNRGSRYPFCTLFDGLSDHFKRITNLEVDLLSLSGDSDEISLTHMLGYQCPEYDSGLNHFSLPKEFQVNEIFHQIALGFKLRSFIVNTKMTSVIENNHISKGLALFWRLIAELDYAMRSGSNYYKATIINMLQSDREKCSPGNGLFWFYENIKRTFKTAIDSYQNPEKRDLCYIWKGVGEYYQAYNEQDPKRAELEYSVGGKWAPVYIEPLPSWNHIHEGHWETRYVTGDEHSPRVYYPYRHRISVYENLLELLDKAFKVCEFKLAEEKVDNGAEEKKAEIVFRIS